jgi:hypothetical protein
MKANVPMGTLLGMIGLRMKIARRKEMNHIREEIPDSLLVHVFNKLPLSIDEFLKVEGGRREIWNYFGDLISKSVENQQLKSNAYNPWSLEEDAQLLKMVKEKSVKELAAQFKRSVGAIRSRLEKLENKEK